MKRILLAGFAGENNSAKVILDTCSPELKKLYLENDFESCAMQIIKAVNASYDFILILGQKPNIKSLYIEVTGRCLSDYIQTAYDHNTLADCLTAAGYKVRMSENAGSYLCNHVYYHGLLAAQSSGSNTQIILLHVPCLKNIADVDHISSVLSAFLLNHEPCNDSHSVSVSV